MLCLASAGLPAPHGRPPALPSTERRLAFERVYELGLWLGGEDGAVCKSGWSSIQHAQGTAAHHGLLRVIDRYSIRSVADVPVGDGCFTGAALAALRNSSVAHEPQVEWTGVDIVPSLIERNTRRLGSLGARFEVADVLGAGAPPLPRAELVFSRQMTQHLCHEEVHLFLAQVANAPAARYLLATTFRTGDDFVNKDIPCASAGYRAQDLTKPPFDLGQPLLWFSERYADHTRVLPIASAARLSPLTISPRAQVPA